MLRVLIFRGLNTVEGLRVFKRLTNVEGVE